MNIWFVGNGRDFSCPICRKKTVVPERGLGALPDNRYLQELIDRIISEEKKICSKHGTILSLFCNDKECQECICVSCSVVKHKGHDIIDLIDKAEEAKKKMQQGIRKANKHMEGWDDLVGEIDRAKASVNKEKDLALKRVEETKQDFNNVMVRLSDILEEATRKQINQIKSTKDNSIKNLNKSRKKIEEKKTGIEKQIEKMEKHLREDCGSEVIKMSTETIGELERILLDSAHINENEVTTKLPKVTQPNFQYQLKLEDYGAASEDVLNIGRPLKTAIPTKWNLLGFKSWTYSKVYVDGNSPVIVYGKKPDDMTALKCFDRGGEVLWEQEMPEDKDGNIKGIAVIESSGQNYIVTTNYQNKEIELRRETDGTLVNKTKLFFTPLGLRFNPSTKQGFVCNDSSKRINTFHLQGEIVTIENENGIPHTMHHLYDMCLAKCSTSLMFVLSSWENSMIRAIDSGSGEVIWEITGEYEGREICPTGMCSDELGNIYVADGLNNRVLFVTCDGEIEKIVFNTNGTAAEVKWLEVGKKLLVRHTSGKRLCLTVYEI